MTLIDKMIDPVLALPRPIKRVVVLCLDAGLCILTVWLALYLRVGEFVALSGDAWPAAVFSPMLALPIFIRFGLYRAVFRYVGPEALLAIVNAVLVYGVIYFSAFTLFSVSGVPRTLGIIQPLLLLLAIGGSRLFGRYWLSGRYRELLRDSTTNRVLIYGAGSSGRQLAAAIGDSRDMKVVGFLDDDASLQGSIIGGRPVWSPDAMKHVVENYSVTEVLLAMSKASRRRRNEILARIRALGVGVRTLPGLMDVARGHITVTDLRPLEIEDMLGRDPVEPDAALMDTNVRGKVVLVTGAGGSIGGELCRQLLGSGPATLLLVESSEVALYQIHRELELLCAAQTPQGQSPATALYPLLGSVTDERRMRHIFAAWRPDTIYHAAAYKHVPLVEHNIVEGVRNNAVGTWSCARLAAEMKVGNFVLVSTDKAVRPTNVMGASKRLAELALQALASVPGETCFSMVRFGNVLGSSGSVVPLFREQIRNGGPVTVTHPDITRYFMTIPEAAQLVIQAGAMAKGGEVFVLDMGAPVKVLDLAHRMIALSGLRVRTPEEPDGDIEIAYTGLRPGEKLYEELLIGENPAPTGHPRVMMANEKRLTLARFQSGLARMQDLLERQDAAGVRTLLAELVCEYEPSGRIVDYLVGPAEAGSEHKPLLRVVSERTGKN
jgi:FlaA1/EpsC-like NDP-sugar epimerase